MTSNFLYGTFRANKRVCSDTDRFCSDLDHFCSVCTIRYPKIDNLRYITCFCKNGIYFYLETNLFSQNRSSRTVSAGPEYWAYLNIAYQSCKNLINVKIVQYVNKNEFILNISFDMCILSLDIEQLNIYNVFVTFVSFPHDALTCFVSEWTSCTFIFVLATNHTTECISNGTGTCHSTLDRWRVRY